MLRIVGTIEGLFEEGSFYRKPGIISDSKKPKDTFIDAYTLEKYEGLSRKKINGILSNPKVSA
jgi:hypothetical protein